MKNPDTGIKLYDAWDTYCEKHAEFIDSMPDDPSQIYRLGFIYELDNMLMAYVAIGTDVQLCRLWVGEEQLGYACSCHGSEFCSHLAIMCKIYTSEGGETPLLVKQFLAAFNLQPKPTGTLEYKFDHYGADEDENEEDDDDVSDDEDEEDDEEDEEEDEEDDFEDLEDEDDLDETLDDELAFLENWTSPEMAGMRLALSKSYCKKSLSLLRQRLQTGNDSLPFDILLAEASQNDWLRNRLLISLGLEFPTAAGKRKADPELIAAFFNDISHEPPLPTYFASGLAEEFTDEDIPLDSAKRVFAIVKVFRELVWSGNTNEALAVLKQVSASEENYPIIDYVIADHESDFRVAASRLLGRKAPLN